MAAAVAFFLLQAEVDNPCDDPPPIMLPPRVLPPIREIIFDNPARNEVEDGDAT